MTAQTHTDVTIVVSDNASTDRTQEIVRTFPHVRYARNDRDLGGPANFNRCVTLCDSEYLAIFHADDVYEPEIVEREVRFLSSRPDINLVMALDLWINERDTVWGRSELPPELCGLAVIPWAVLVPALMRHTNTFLRTPTAMMRTEAVRAAGGWDERKFASGGDLDLWLRLARTRGVGILNEHLMRYRVSRQQWSASTERGRVEPAEFFAVMDQYIDQVPTTSADRVAYSAHRSADQVVRAINLCRRREVPAAQALLNRTSFYPESLAPVTLRVRAHLIAGVLLRQAIRIGVGRAVGSAMHLVRSGGLRSLLRDHAPVLAAFLARTTGRGRRS